MDRINRIQNMEACFDRVLNHLKSKDIHSISLDIQLLKEYYTSSLWLEDYDEDQKGNLPKDLKRGVLSQDGIDHVLDKYEELRKDKNKQAIYDLLKEKELWHVITEHKAVYNMEEMNEVDLPYKEADAKNLFVRDDKKRNYYLICVRGSKQVNLKEFSQTHQTRRLSFASEKDLFEILNLTPGSVSPLGILNDLTHKVKVFMDQELVDLNLIGVHPNDNRATVVLKTTDLISLLQEHGNSVEVIKIEG